MGYEPTKIELQNCKKMLREEFKINDEVKIQQYTDELMSISYKIGGDYNIDTLRKIADSCISKNLL